METCRIFNARPLGAVLGLLLLTGCATSGGGIPTAGEGLYSDFDEARLAEVGWPNDLDQPYWWPENTEGEWGILYDAEGVPYGPNTYYHFRRRLDHPDFAATDSTMVGRWFSINRHERLKEVMFGRWLELHDLAHQDMVKRLRYTPPLKILIYAAPEFDDYLMVTGKDYWVTQIADGPFIAYEPIRALWARTLALHAVRNGVALAFLDMKCHGLVPPWLRQGLASYLAQEGGPLRNYVGEFRGQREVLWSPHEVMQHIHPLYERENGRIALYNAFLMAWNLAENYGWEKIQDLLDLMEQGLVFEDAVPQAYGVSADRLLELIDPQSVGDPTNSQPPEEKADPASTPDPESSTIPSTTPDEGSQP